MRLVYAGIFILLGLLSMLVLVNRVYPDLDPSVMKILMPATIVILTAAAYFLFNKRGAWKLKNPEIARMYESRGELTYDVCRARRAFELDDVGNKVTWYVIELENGKAISLWDKLPAGPPGFDENPKLRCFPCTEFTILRHVTGFAVDIICGGEVIKPEVLTLPAKHSSWSLDFLSRDGEVLRGETFETVRAKVSKAIKQW